MGWLQRKIEKEGARRQLLVTRVAILHVCRADTQRLQIAPTTVSICIAVAADAPSRHVRAYTRNGRIIISDNDRIIKTRTARHR